VIKDICKLYGDATSIVKSERDIWIEVDVRCFKLVGSIKDDEIYDRFKHKVTNYDRQILSMSSYRETYLHKKDTKNA